MNGRTNRNRLALLALGGMLLGAAAPAVSMDRAELLARHVEAKGAPADPEAGARLWNATGIKGRRCATCHGEDLSRPGRHKRTGKPIEPMAASANPKRYTDPRKVAKWFRRNCKWTLGRECTAAEKADVLAWLNSL